MSAGPLFAMLLVALVLGALLIQVQRLGAAPTMLRPLRWAAKPIRPAVTVVGWLALVIGADLGLGRMWTAWQGEARERSREVSVTVEGQIPRDPRADSPAYDGYPWAEDYLDELQLPRYDYKPFLRGQLRPSEGRYVNTEDGVRRSYQPAGAAAEDALEVWFFGGSTLFGEGQRDEHTIPSQIARLAEDEGIIIRPVNMGHQGQLLWQEMLRLEMEVAERGSPDLAVFFDGTNDYNYQLADQRGQPTHGDMAATEQQLGGAGQPLPSQIAPPPISVWDKLQQSSLLGHVVDRIGSLSFIAAAGASPADDDDGFSESLVRDVAEVYGRSVEMCRVVADAAGVPALFFWQPIKVPTDEYEAIADELPDGVIDITDAYDGVSSPIFIDGGHTNEVGAGFVAEAMYRSIRPQLLAATGGEP